MWRTNFKEDELILHNVDESSFIDAEIDYILNDNFEPLTDEEKIKIEKEIDDFIKEQEEEQKEEDKDKLAFKKQKLESQKSIKDVVMEEAKNVEYVEDTEMEDADKGKGLKKKIKRKNILSKIKSKVTEKIKKYKKKRKSKKTKKRFKKFVKKVMRLTKKCKKKKYRNTRKCKKFLQVVK